MVETISSNRIDVQCRGGSKSKVDPTRGKFGLQPGQVVLVRPGVAGRILGVGGWPNEFGLEKLWVKEENGDCTIVESPRDVKVITV